MRACMRDMYLVQVQLFLVHDLPEGKVVFGHWRTEGQGREREAHTHMHMHMHTSHERQ